MGNNFTGIRIKGGIENETLLLNDKSFWSGGPNNATDPKRQAAMESSRRFLLEGDIPNANNAAKGMWGPGWLATYLPLGMVHLKFDHSTPVQDYLRTLNLDRALTTVTYKVNGTTFRREYFASYPDQVVVIRISADKPASVGFDLSMTYPNEMEGHGASVTSLNPNGLILNCRAPYSNLLWDDVKGIHGQCRLQVTPLGGQIQVKDNKITVQKADSVLVLLTTASNYNGAFQEPGMKGVDPQALNEKRLASATKKTYDQLLSNHLQDYQSIFRRFWLEVNGQKINPKVLAAQYARYDMICCSRSGDRPHNQQGMWCSEWKPASWCAHFLNENVEKHYGIIETMNLPETGEPLWNWMDELAQNGTLSAKNDWGFHGWLATHCSDIWATTFLKGGSNQYAIWPMGGVWLCNNLWDHYAFSQDRLFLSKRAYPLMKGASEFCLDYLIDNGKGQLVTAPSSSPENSFCYPDQKHAESVSMGSTVDLALIQHYLGSR